MGRCGGVYFVSSNACTLSLCSEFSVLKGKKGSVTRDYNYELGAGRFYDVGSSEEKLVKIRGPV